ncbi:hypothetical protein [Marinobacterium sp. BA1]|uniref:hypothetical protein n=1 Tax=Marinobacterium sp. BA1 TaxID=3138931 RepID=UPI0032E5B894
MLNINKSVWIGLTMVVAMTAHAEKVTSSGGPEEEGSGIVESVDTGTRIITIDGSHFQIHLTTKVGQIVSWPGKYIETDASSLRVGDQVFFDADFSKPEPYKLEYIHRLIK